MRATPALLVLALLGPVQHLDDAARGWVLAHRTPALAAPMHALSDKSRAALLVAAAVGLLAGPASRAVVAEAAIVLVPVNLAVEGLKRAVGRPRPDGERRRANSSFPSSHAANAFAVATVLARRWRRGAPVFLLLAAGVAYSRMFLDRHWLSDVTAGALLGVGLAIVIGVWCGARITRRLASGA